MTAAPARDPRLAKIHVAKKQLGLDDDTYRDVLQRVTGQRSSKGLIDGQIEAVLAEFMRLGWRPAQGKKLALEPRADLRFVFVLWALLAKAGRVKAGRPALNAFICAPNFARKWGEVPTDLRFLTPARASDVIEALKDLCHRHRVPMELPR